MTQIIWSLITLSITLENVLSTFTGLKFNILLLLGLPLSSGTTDAVFVFFGKIYCVMHVLMAFVSNAVKKLTESFTS